MSPLLQEGLALWGGLADSLAALTPLCVRRLPCTALRSAPVPYVTSPQAASIFLVLALDSCRSEKGKPATLLCFHFLPLRSSHIPSKLQEGDITQGIFSSVRTGKRQDLQAATGDGSLGGGAEGFHVVDTLTLASTTLH